MSDTTREIVDRYHEAYRRANSATLGSSEFADAMAEVRGLWDQLRAAGIQPNETWRSREQGKLRPRSRR